MCPEGESINPFTGGESINPFTAITQRFTLIWNGSACWGLIYRLTTQLAGTVKYTHCISTKGNTPPPKKCPGYDTKQSDGQVPIILELWGMQSTLFSLLPGPLWSGVVSPDRVLSIGQIELFDIKTVCKQMINTKLNC